MGNYGNRECLSCGEVFTAIHPAQVTCSAKCRVVRKRACKRLSSAKARKRHKAYVAALVQQVKDLGQEVSRLNAELAAQRDASSNQEASIRVKELESLVESLRSQLDKALEKEAEAKAELARIKAVQGQDPTPTATSKKTDTKQVPQVAPMPLQKCQRMSLRATNLPCGERDECFHPPCDSLPCSGIREPGDLICPTCKQVFTPSHHRQKYCSKQCLTEAMKAKVRG